MLPEDRTEEVAGTATDVNDCLDVAKVVGLEHFLECFDGFCGGSVVGARGPLVVAEIVMKVLAVRKLEGSATGSYRVRELAESFVSGRECRPAEDPSRAPPPH